MTELERAARAVVDALEHGADTDEIRRRARRVLCLVLELQAPPAPGSGPSSARPAISTR